MATATKADEREAADSAADASYRLSESPYHLLKRAHQHATEIFTRSGLADSMTARQVVVLAALAEGEGSTQSDLVRVTGVDRSTLAEMVSRMEQKGLIVRRADHLDGRAKTVWLSETGRARLEEAIPALRAVDEALLALLPRPRQQSFVNALDLVVTSAEAGQANEVEEQRREKFEARRKAKQSAAGRKPRRRTAS